MRASVMDASAMLALFLDEPGAEKVEKILNNANEAGCTVFISAVNWAEVLYTIQRRRGMSGFEVACHFERTTALEAVPVDRELAESAASLKAEHGLGLADAFAAALASNRMAELVTGDIEFKTLENEIKINWLTRPR